MGRIKPWLTVLAQLVMMHALHALVTRQISVEHARQAKFSSGTNVQMPAQIDSIQKAMTDADSARQIARHVPMGRHAANAQMGKSWIVDSATMSVQILKNSAIKCAKL